MNFIDDEKESKWSIRSDPIFIGSLFCTLGLVVGIISSVIYLFIEFKVTTNYFPYTGPQKEAMLGYLYLYALHVSLIIVLPSVFIGLVFINFHSWADASRIIMPKLGLVEVSLHGLAVFALIGAFITGIASVDLLYLELSLVRIAYFLIVFSCLGSLFRIAISIELFSRSKTKAIWTFLIIEVLFAAFHYQELMIIAALLSTL